ncbi:hypothetical protein V2A60_002238 [Cordyceps javanica]
MADSTSPRLQMQYKRLEAAASQLEERYKNNAGMLEEVAAAKELVNKYIAAYEEGKLFFARDLVTSLDRQIDALQQQDGAADKKDGGGDVVTLEDVIGRQESWPLTYPNPSQHKCDTFCIRYSVHQYMTHMSSKYPENLLEVETPLGIVYCDFVTPSGWPLPDLEAAFRAHQASWDQSVACQELAATITTSAAALRTPIRKIVCFGLGRLDDWERTTSEELAESTRRAATQHAAALTMAAALARAQDGDGDGDGEVRCYVQDPAYAAVEKELLATLGFTVLPDPKGFLEVDDATLVFSVHPNVPVRQVVTDMGWPAAMVWDTIETDRNVDEEGARDYRIETRWGREERVSPWTTDEGSTRVTEMARHYTYSPFPGNPAENQFGRLGIYFRKPT